MQKLLILLSAVVMTANMMAHEADTVYTLVIPSKTATLQCDGNIYFYGREAMKPNQMLDWYAQHNCQAAYQQFAKGQRMAKAGWALLAVGAAMDVSAVVCGSVYWYNRYYSGTYNKLPSADRGDQTTNRIDPLRLATIDLAVGAVLFEAACVPLLVVGYHKMHSSADVYNESCTTARVQPYWTLQASSHGLGLALNF